MSTRGAICRAHGDGFKGVYHHFDAYPTGLGATLWELYHAHFERALSRMLRVLIDEHPAGWSTIINTDFRLAPGYYDHSPMDGVPCVTCGQEGWRHYRQYYATHEATPPPGIDVVVLGHSYVPPELPSRPRCYCHGELSEGPQEINEGNAAACGCEYVYVFDETNHQMTVLSSYNPGGGKMIGMFGLGNPKAYWSALASFSLDGERPTVLDDIDEQAG